MRLKTSSQASNKLAVAFLPNWGKGLRQACDLSATAEDSTADSWLGNWVIKGGRWFNWPGFTGRYGKALSWAKDAIISQVTKQKYRGRVIPGLSWKRFGNRERFASLTKHHFLCDPCRLDIQHQKTGLRSRDYPDLPIRPRNRSNTQVTAL